MEQKTWTFQPDADVRQMMAEMLGPTPKFGDKSRLINLAVRIQSKLAGQIIAAQRDLEARAIEAVAKATAAAVSSLEANGARVNSPVSRLAEIGGNC